VYEAVRSETQECAWQYIPAPVRAPGVTHLLLALYPGAVDARVVAAAHGVVLSGSFLAAGHDATREGGCESTQHHVSITAERFRRQTKPLPRHQIALSHFLHRTLSSLHTLLRDGTCTQGQVRQRCGDRQGRQGRQGAGCGQERRPPPACGPVAGASPPQFRAPTQHDSTRVNAARVTGAAARAASVTAAGAGAQYRCSVAAIPDTLRPPSCAADAAHTLARALPRVCMRLRSQPTCV
jgi:hypothetical protein